MQLRSLWNLRIEEVVSIVEMSMVPTNDISKDTPRRVVYLFRPHIALLIAAIIFTSSSAGLQIAILRMVQPFIDEVVSSSLIAKTPAPKEISTLIHLEEQEEVTVPKTDKLAIDMNNVRVFVFDIMVLFILSGITHGIGLYLSVLFGQKVIVDLREKIFNHLQNLSLSFFEDRQTGGIMSWITNDVNVFRNFSSNQINSFFNNAIKVIGPIIVIFFISWKLTLISILILPFLGLVIHRAGMSMRKATRRVQGKLSDISAFLQEVISAIQIIRSFGTESHEMTRFHGENVQTFKAEMKKAKISAFLTPSIQMIVAVGLLIILLVGINQVSSGILSWGKLFTFVIMLQVVSENAMRLGQTYANLNELYGAGDRLFEFLDEKPGIVEIKNPVKLKDVKGDVSFRNITFSYGGGEIVLKDINLDVPSGKVIALVGPSGAGKTSLVKLIPRFYDPDEGQVLIDDIDIKSVTLKSLREQLGIVSQETILFSTTIRENIAYGKLNATMDEIESAAKAANVDEFIKKFPDGYETIVGQRGSKLSGGQAQRISIARAILKNPRILILDEATSSLDARSEELVQKALEELMKGRTTFIIAHRLTTIQNADEIIVLMGGSIVQRGTHEELLAADGIYRGLYQTQVLT